MIFQLSIANQIIEVHSLHSRVQERCLSYLTNGKKPTMEIHINQDDIDIEKKIISRTNSKVSVLPYYDKEHEMLALLRKMSEALLDKNTVLMHGAVVSDGEFAYMFTAPSGTGKTTRARLFLQNIPGSYVINGDKPFLIIEKKQVLVSGSPWCGKEGMNTNTVQPLCALFLLERADKTKITELTFSDAFKTILEQTYLPSKSALLKKTLMLLKQMDGKVKLYRYQSSMDSASVLQAWNVAKQKDS